MAKRDASTRLALAALVLGGLTCGGGGGRPDLFVASLSCSRGNLVLTVGNSGGPLREGWSASAALSIEGQLPNTILLHQATRTSDGGLEEGRGGTASYLTAYRLDRITRVDVSLDSAGEIAEADEENNAWQSHYVAPCDLPDLVVEEVALTDDCRVRIVLANRGDGDVPREAWSYDYLDFCGVSIYLDGKETACVPFLSFNPDHTLRPVGGTATLTSGIRVREETHVLVVVDSTLAVAEGDENNNRRSAMLTCGRKSAPAG